MTSSEEKSASTARYVSGANGGIPSGATVELLSVFNNGTRKKPSIRYEVSYAGRRYWVDADALVLP